jgi:hypothetical protein
MRSCRRCLICCSNYCRTSILRRRHVLSRLARVAHCYSRGNQRANKLRLAAGTVKYLLPALVNFATFWYSLKSRTPTFTVERLKAHICVDGSSEKPGEYAGVSAHVAELGTFLVALSKLRWDLLPSSKAPYTLVTGHRRTYLLSTRSLSTWLQLAPYYRSIFQVESACASVYTRHCMAEKLLPVCGTLVVTPGTPTTAFGDILVTPACTCSLKALRASPWFSLLTLPASAFLTRSTFLDRKCCTTSTRVCLGTHCRL